MSSAKKLIRDKFPVTRFARAALHLWQVFKGTVMNTPFPRPIFVMPITLKNPFLDILIFCFIKGKFFFFVLNLNSKIFGKHRALGHQINFHKHIFARQMQLAYTQKFEPRSACNLTNMANPWNGRKLCQGPYFELLGLCGESIQADVVSLSPPPAPAHSLGLP